MIFKNNSENRLGGGGGGEWASHFPRAKTGLLQQG